jgi:hypothetical protein
MLSAVLLLTASLLIGIAQIAILPPWEGFDETAHFSYIQQLAEKHVWPGRGDPLSLEVEDYAKVAPMPYSSTPPYDDNGHWTYHNFFGSSAETIEAGREANYSRHEGPRPWQPGASPNWQSQHAPLYYLLLVPFFFLSKTWGLVNQLFLLRSVSYAFAWIGLCVAVLSARMTAKLMCDRRDDTIFPAMMVLAPAMWPFIFPAWFPEMARLGNDSLIVLIAAVGWVGLLKLTSSDGGVRQHGFVGFLCGLGMLTKATFLPFTGVVLGFLSFRLWRDRRGTGVLQRRLAGLAAFIAILIATAGWWYLRKFFETGNVLGSADISKVVDAGGLVKGLTKNGSMATLVMFARGWLSIVGSFMWSGTWSFVKPPILSISPFVLMALLVAVAQIDWLRKSSGDIRWVPVLTLAAFLIGLGYHLAVFIAAYGVWGTPGWYLHSFAPVFAPILAMGTATLLRSKLRFPVMALLFYPLLFIPAVGALEALVYAGCGSKMSTINSYDFHSMSSCMMDGNFIYSHLSVVGSPLAGSVLFAVGFVFLALGLWLTVRPFATALKVGSFSRP